MTQEPRIETAYPPPPNYIAVTTEPPRSRATVEIETWAKGGTPKVTVRVDDDDPYKAKSLAVAVYLQTVQDLEEAEEERFGMGTNDED